MAERTAKQRRPSRAIEETEAESPDLLLDGEPADVQRRAPFSTNPKVGIRGRRAQQRILEAALQVFGEVGYHRCGVSGITDVAECSRAAFYQYFSSKEDVFRHLAGQVARQLTASAEALDPITPDAAGWQNLHAWIERRTAIYERYEPVFRVFHAAAASDEAVAVGSQRIGARDVAIVQSKLTTTDLSNRHVGDVIALMLNVMSWTPRLAEVIRSALPPSSLPGDRLANALTDVVHRTLFGLDESVNVHPAPRRRIHKTRGGTALLEGMRTGEPQELTPAGARTLELLLDAAHDVLVLRGFHATRVDDITEAAGLSHGAFYRYFENKGHLVRLLALRSLQKVWVAFDEIPDVAGDPGEASAALRQWLRRYNATHASQADIIRVWIDATGDDPQLGVESSAALEWGRQRIVHFLSSRGFGDVDAESLLMVALLDAIGARRGSPATIEAGALIIERGFLGSATSPPRRRRSAR